MIQWSLIIGILIIAVAAAVMIMLWHSVMAYGIEKIEYIGTSDWLNEVDKCVDLYHETEQNETLYYGCMNKLARDNVHYQ